MEHYGIPYSIQELTCLGLSLVHSASLAARSNPIKGFEYNARQYLPFAYKEIQERHKNLFTVREGFVRTDSLEPVGLGFSIEVIISYKYRRSNRGHIWRINIMRTKHADPSEWPMWSRDVRNT